MAEDITARLLYDLFAAVPPPLRWNGVWVMSKETLEAIKRLPEAEQSGPVWGDSPLIFGRPVEIQPEAQRVTFIGREPVEPPPDPGPPWAQALSEKLDEIKALVEVRLDR